MDDADDSTDGESGAENDHDIDSRDDTHHRGTDHPLPPMNTPIPSNRLVAFTLAGALLTTVVAAGLALPGLGLASPGDTARAPTDTNGSGHQLAADAPTPNQNFTPAVQTRSGDEDGEYEGAEYEAGEEHEDGEEGGEYADGEEGEASEE